MRLGFRQAFCALALATLATAGCNTVLGIEEAQQAWSASGGTSGGSGSTPPPAPSLVSCFEPDDACTNCVNTSCLPQLTDMLVTNEGRFALDRYRQCLGQQCLDNSDFDCLEGLGGLLSACVRDNCLAPCSSSALVPTATLYCRCMESKCAGSVQSSLAGNCSATATTDPEDLHCRWEHCEFASPELPQHCDHAVGMGACSGSDPAFTCTDGSISGYPCDTSSPQTCCSETCQGGVCR